MRDKRRPTVGDSTSTVRTSEIDERFFAAIADMLGDTQDGLAGTEIDVALCAFDIRSEGPSCCKKSRLQEWVQSFDREPAGHEKIHKLLELAISLARFSKFPRCFSISQNTSNKTLLPLEWEIDEAGQLRPTQLARSIKQAHWRAGDLRHALEGQQVHRTSLNTIARSGSETTTPVRFSKRSKVCSNASVRPPESTRIVGEWSKWPSEGTHRL